MSGVGRICLYCSTPIGLDDRVALCDRCSAAHHEECWDRNGRCSTFRCPGAPRTMRGVDLPAALQAAFQRSNEQPQSCPFCVGKAYAGTLQGRRGADARHPAGPGLLFVEAREGRPKRGLFGRLKARSWWLPGAHVKARSCGRCRRIFLWGAPVDEPILAEHRQACLPDRQAAQERYCPHCGTKLAAGEICLDTRVPGGARFECDEVPDFHKDWLGRNILDRYIFNKWPAPFTALPAHSCPDCQYTEVLGRPIYRFL